MIAFLTGRPQIVDDQLILVVQGVGYGLHTTAHVLHAAQQTEELSVYVYTHVREDALQLFGFLQPEEKKIFELMLSVSGVGPTTALHLAERDPQQLVSAVQEAQVSFFTSVPRVGKKLAQKIIIELRGKLGELKELNLTPLDSTQSALVSALENLGFSETDAHHALEHLDLESLSEADAIKQAIKLLGKNRS